MRQIVLDTETTGTEAARGDRVIEIGCWELLDRRPTGRKFHCYLNPDRDSHPEALKVHGLTTDFLSDKPRIDEIVDEFLAFIRDGELVIHNAAFDVGFLNAELERCGAHYGSVADHVVGVLDTYKLAREMYPGQRASLDALCRRFGIDNTERQLHGALLDAGLLLDVYLALTSGQFDLGFGSEERAPVHAVADVAAHVYDVRVVCASESERVAHRARMAVIEKQSGQRLWIEAVETP